MRIPLTTCLLLTLGLTHPVNMLISAAPEEGSALYLDGSGSGSGDGSDLGLGEVSESSVPSRSYRGGPCSTACPYDGSERGSLFFVQKERNSFSCRGFNTRGTLQTNTMEVFGCFLVCLFGRRKVSPVRYRHMAVQCCTEPRCNSEKTLRTLKLLPALSRHEGESENDVDSTIVDSRMLDSSHWPKKDSEEGYIILGNGKSRLSDERVVGAIIGGSVTGVVMSVILLAIVIYVRHNKDIGGCFLGEEVI